jgi:long-subunit acyl-CoA synthetase (AMP-forming)
MASSLSNMGVQKGDTVAVFAFNTPEMFESHFSVPMSGAILNTINVRLDANTVAYILDDGNAKALIVDRELFDIASKALSVSSSQPTVILIDDEFADTKPEVNIDVINYETLISEGDPSFKWRSPEDEWQPVKELRYGIAYGFDKIDFARQTQHLVLPALHRQQEQMHQNVRTFIEKCDMFFGEQRENTA